MVCWGYANEKLLTNQWIIQEFNNYPKSGNTYHSEKPQISHDFCNSIKFNCYCLKVKNFNKNLRLQLELPLHHRPPKLTLTLLLAAHNLQFNTNWCCKINIIKHWTFRMYGTSLGLWWNMQKMSNMNHVPWYPNANLSVISVIYFKDISNEVYFKYNNVQEILAKFSELLWLPQRSVFKILCFFPDCSLVKSKFRRPSKYKSKIAAASNLPLQPSYSPILLLTMTARNVHSAKNHHCDDSDLKFFFQPSMYQ